MSKATNSQWFTKLLLSIGLIFLGICVVFILRPQYLVPDHKSISVKDRIELENKVRTTWIQAISGLGLFVAAYSAWLNYQSSQQKLEADKKNSEDQLTEIRNKLEFDRENSAKQLAEIRKKLKLDRKTSKRNLKLADSKQITERFSKAVEQLGNEASITVRLGAIYSLERIAKNSKYDHWTIMEVLSAFIREKSNDNREPDSTIPEDIQAALTVIGRRNTENDPENGEIDLRGANLNGVNLNGAKLDKVNFNNAKLNKAEFIQASLNKVNFLNADLNNANFREANLNNADFFNTNLDNAGFVKANFTITSFFLAKLTETKFHEANLTRTDFSQAILTKTKFEKATLIEAIFDGADFFETKFNEANIERASFHHIKKSHITANIENLTIKQILEAKNCDKALYNDDFWEQLKPYLSTQNE